MRSILVLLLVILSPLVLRAQEDYRYGAVFAIAASSGGDQALLYNETAETLELMRWEAGRLKKTASTSVPGRPAAACAFRSGIAVAYGSSRIMRDAPVKVVLYDQELRDGRTIFENKGERNQPVFLEDTTDGLFFAYFESKYFTRAGLLKPAGDSWGFEEKFKVRLGMSLALHDKDVLVGRPYRDEEAGTGELLLFRGGKWEELPSFRGVSSVAFVPRKEALSPQILIGDGWHQNYGKLAEPRLTLITPEKTAAKRYTTRTVSVTSGQTNVVKIIPVGSPPQVIAAGGDKFIDVYFPDRDWARTRAYSKMTDLYEANMDFAVLRQDGAGVLAVWDGELKTVEMPKR